MTETVCMHCEATTERPFASGWRWYDDPEGFACTKCAEQTEQLLTDDGWSFRSSGLH